MGYTRVKGIKPGETKVGEVAVKLGELGRVDTMGNLVLYPGRYEFGLDVEGVDAGGLEAGYVVVGLEGEKVVLDLFTIEPVKIGRAHV